MRQPPRGRGWMGGFRSVNTDRLGNLVDADLAEESANLQAF
jgi:hypothetical protein